MKNHKPLTDPTDIVRRLGAKQRAVVGALGTEFAPAPDYQAAIRGCCVRSD